MELKGIEMENNLESFLVLIKKEQKNGWTPIWSSYRRVFQIITEGTIKIDSIILEKR